MAFLKTLLDTSNQATPQTQPLGGINQHIGARQVASAAGGFVFPIDKWAALDRFLTIGTMGGTYYATEKKITETNLAGVAELLAEDGPRVVARVVEISQAGRAQKQDYGLAVLAMAASFHSETVKQAFAIRKSCQIHGESPEAIAYRNEERTRLAAYAAIPKVCRTASTLFQFLSYLKGRRTFTGRGLKRALANWYNDRSVDNVAYQMVKYGQRYDFTHRDVLRLAHPDPTDAGTPFSGDGNAPSIVAAQAQRANLYKWVVGKEANVELLPAIVTDAEAAKTATGDLRIGYAKRLPREALPTEWLNDSAIWEALLYGNGSNGMPLTALIRNLGNLSKHKVLTAHSDACRYVVGELLNQTRIASSRVHPITLYAAMKTYASGSGLRGSGTWAPVNAVIDALTESFYLAMGNVNPTGKRLLIGLDVSASMRAPVLGIQNCLASEIAAAMALVHVRTEPIDPYVLPFATQPYRFEVARDERLDRLAARLAHFTGGTDCVIPIAAAALPNVTPEAPDAVIIYTDNETWAGLRHASEAVPDYRKRKPEGRIVCAATTATGTQFADPKDPLTLGVCGFDSGAPTIINGFISGSL
jgi:60 kDa SS-A/Ro ribonucleoprotein